MRSSRWRLVIAAPSAAPNSSCGSIVAVQDSRCPSDVACIQAGDATVGITVRQQRKTQSYVLHTGGPGPRSVVHEGVTIALEELVPTRVSLRATPARNYRVTLRGAVEER